MPKPKKTDTSEMRAITATHVMCSAADETRLRRGGFLPVVRWADILSHSDTPLKTIEALTLLDRREEAAKAGETARGRKEG